MRLGLGNTLLNNGLSNPDLLSLDLQFAADKGYSADGTVVSGTGQFDITSRRGPAAKFTRASGATEVGPYGLIRYAPENLLINSNLYSSASATNITATTISGSPPVTSSSQIRQLSLTGTGASTSLQYNITGAGDAIKTLSVFVKKPTSGAAPYFTIGFASSNAAYAGIQLTMSGAAPVISVTSTAAGGFAVVSSSIQAFPDDWYRVSVVASGVINNTCFPTLYPSNAVYDGVSDIRQTLTSSGSNIVYVFGAQLERHTSARQYIPTTTAVAYGPRFDHDPVTRECKGLLIEEQRTNLFQRSSELGNAYWSSGGISISEDDQTSPDGGLNADTITSLTGTPTIYREVVCTASTVYTLSFYIKLGTLPSNNFKFAVYNVTGASFIAQDIIPTITPVTTEWRRVTYTFTTPPSCVLVRPYLVRFPFVTTGTFFLWGAQLEAGLFATSYIPTTTGTGARSADVCTISSSAFTSFYNQPQGTYIVSGRMDYAALYSRIFGETGVTSPTLEISSISAASAPTGVTYRDQIGSSDLAVSFTAGSYKIAAAYTSGTNHILCLNGGSVSATAASGSATPAQLAIGSGGGASGINTMNGTISSLRYYKKRLPNAKLQTLTA
jgi:hypothetical protein